MHLKSTGVWAFDTRDLMRAASCDHCTTISALRSLRVPAAMQILQPHIDKQNELRALGQDKTLAQKYGDLFESSLEQQLRQAFPGQIAEPDLPSDASLEDRFAATLNLMRQAFPVIYQGALIYSNGRSEFRGKPDFLVREDFDVRFIDGRLTIEQVRKPSSPASPKYTAWDAKYASSAKPAHALQVGIYISALESVGMKSEIANHGVILGSRTIQSFTEAEVVPAMRLAWRHLEDRIFELSEAVELSKTPELLENFSWQCETKRACDICEYPELCDETRHESQDLILVHSIRANQRKSLIESGIRTIPDLAAAEDTARPADLSETAWQRLRRQARLQAASTEAGQPQFELLDNARIAYLPPASEHDIFFDMEGFPYFGESGGLEYLFGNYTRGNEFVDFWAHDRAGEKKAFEDFIDWAVARLQADAAAHVYHYAAYEQSALRRLANRHATREREVDWLLSNGKMVDLAAFVTNSLVIGEESYSIKKLEAFYGFERRSTVKKATDSVDGYDAWLQMMAVAEDASADPDTRAAAASDAAELLATLRDYNLEDVASTLALYNWLAQLPSAGTSFGTDSSEQGPDPSQIKSQQELEALIDRTRELFEPLEGWVEGQNPEVDLWARAWAALAHSILYYHREKVMYWADLNIRVAKDDPDLIGDRKAALLTNVIETASAVEPDKNGVLKSHRSFTGCFDPEDIYQPKPGESVVVRYSKDGNRHAWCFGKVTDVARGTLDFSAQFPVSDSGQIPTAIFAHTLIAEDVKVRALDALAHEVTQAWQSPFSPPPNGWPAIDLLLRREPRLAGLASLPEPNTDDYLPAVIEAVENLNHSVLAIQGPPGTGKTYLASQTIAHLIGLGKRIGVVTTSHTACENLLEAAIRAGVPVSHVMKPKKTGDSGHKPWSTPSPAGIPKAVEKIAGGALIGGTAWTFSNEGVANLRLDYIFIDEAAQFSMVDALAVSRAAKNLVLLGDPQQLAQVVQAIHPGGVENSALGHYMGNHAILPKTHGYFVEVTRRLHPAVNAAVSWLSYEGKLKSHESTRNHLVPGHEPGLVCHEVNHSDNSTWSLEEARVVLEVVQNHLGHIPASEILVISPYNAQVETIQRLLAESGINEVEVGTVDRFQGREASVVVYSFAASSSEDAPRGLEFVLDQNRLNVGISRAKTLCHLVYSPNLLKANFQSINELKAVSRLAGLRDFAVEVVV